MKHTFPPEHLEFIREAIAKHDVTLAAKPGDLNAEYNKALMLLSIGEFEEGWPLFECRLEVPNSIFSYKWFPVPRWDGADIAGKHVLLWLEQGIGDQIMGASMIPDLAAKAASVLVMADRRFAPLFRRSFPENVTFYKFGDPVCERMENWGFDCQISMTDLGLMFRKTFEDFPGTPFLKPDSAKVAALRAKYQNGDTVTPLVGFSWMSANAKYGELKSIAPNDYVKLLTVPGVKYVSLQYGDNPQDMDVLRRLGAEFVYDETIDPLVSLEDSAAQIAAMDMVVSVSNSTVHLAGSMGVPCTNIIPVGHGRVWYWFTGMERSCWYNSVRIRRTETPNEWGGAVARGVLDVMQLTLGAVSVAAE